MSSGNVKIMAWFITVLGCLRLDEIRFVKCLLVYCLSKLKPHKEQYNNFFIYHSLLYTSTATTNNSNNNNYNIIVLDLVLHGTSVFT